METVQFRALELGFQPGNIVFRYSSSEKTLDRHIALNNTKMPLPTILLDFPTGLIGNTGQAATLHLLHPPPHTHTGPTSWWYVGHPHHFLVLYYILVIYFSSYSDLYKGMQCLVTIST